MTTYFVSRHKGAIEWARQQGLPVDHQVEHLDVASIKEGDRIIGTLPVNHAARVCDARGRYLHLSLDLPAEKRGQELSAEDMLNYGARIEEYLVKKLPEVLAVEGDLS